MFLGGQSPTEVRAMRQPAPPSASFLSSKLYKALQQRQGKDAVLLQVVSRKNAAGSTKLMVSMNIFVDRHGLLDELKVAPLLASFIKPCLPSSLWSKLYAVYPFASCLIPIPE